MHYRKQFLVIVTITLGLSLGLDAVPLMAQVVAESQRSEATGAEAEVSDLASDIEYVREQWKVPGLSVAVVKDGKVLLSQGFGYLQNGESEKVDGQSLFAIASNTKAFTTAALAILVDEGKLHWDDRVTKYLPWFRLKDPTASADMRVRDLVCHRSGLGTFSGDLLWWGTPYSPREVLERAAEIEPASSFRSAYGYSNLMFLAAGLVIEQVSGESWAGFVDSRILRVAGMERTVCSVLELQGKTNVASPHKTVGLDSEPIAWVNWDTMAAAGGIISCSDDVAKWMQVQLSGGCTPEGVQIFSKSAGWEMWQAQTPIRVSRESSMRNPSVHFRSYGLGWSLSDSHGRKLVGHGGGYDGMYSRILMVPEEQLGVVVLTNSMTGAAGYLAEAIVNRMLDIPETTSLEDKVQEFAASRNEFDERIRKATTPMRTDTRPSHQLEDYCDSYRCSMYGDARVDLEDGKLVLRLLPNPDLVADLEHLHFDTFVIRWRKEFAWFDAGTANFVTNAKGIVHKIELDVPNDDLWFDELKLERRDP